MASRTRRQSPKAAEEAGQVSLPFAEGQSAAERGGLGVGDVAGLSRPPSRPPAAAPQQTPPAEVIPPTDVQVAETTQGSSGRILLGSPAQVQQDAPAPPRVTLETLREVVLWAKSLRARASEPRGAPRDADARAGRGGEGRRRRKRRRPKRGVGGRPAGGRTAARPARGAEVPAAPEGEGG